MNKDMNDENLMKPINGVEAINEEKQMTLDEFWELVEKINWPNKGHRNLGLTKYEIKWGNFWEWRLRNILQGVLRSVSYINTGHPYRWPMLSDDSFWDLTSHIVGLGKDVYISVLKDPKTIENYLDTYKENLSYCFN